MHGVVQFMHFYRHFYFKARFQGQIAVDGEIATAKLKPWTYNQSLLLGLKQNLSEGIGTATDCDESFIKWVHS